MVSLSVSIWQVNPFFSHNKIILFIVVLFVLQILDRKGCSCRIKKRFKVRPVKTFFHYLIKSCNKIFFI